MTSKANVKILIDHKVHDEGDDMCIQNVVYQNVLE